MRLIVKNGGWSIPKTPRDESVQHIPRLDTLPTFLTFLFNKAIVILKHLMFF